VRTAADLFLELVVLFAGGDPNTSHGDLQNLEI
jgi:hypothetical protein